MKRMSVMKGEKGPGRVGSVNVSASKPLASQQAAPQVKATGVSASGPQASPSIPSYSAASPFSLSQRLEMLRSISDKMGFTHPDAKNPARGPITQTKQLFKDMGNMFSKPAMPSKTPMPSK